MTSVTDHGHSWDALCQGSGGLTRGVAQRQIARSMRKVSKMAAGHRKGAASPAAPAPERGGRAQQKLETRRRIRDAAWALFTELGYDGTTTKAVAERAEVAAGTVFVHARDK